MSDATNTSTLGALREALEHSDCQCHICRQARSRLDPAQTVEPAADGPLPIPRPGEVAEVAYCPEHGLHGCRLACFECGKPVVQVPMVVASEQPPRAAAIADLLSLMDGLDRSDRYTEVLRVAKIAEEAGEAMQAVIAYHDVNPRKEPGPLSAVADELADVALTAKIALESFGFDSNRAVAEREEAVFARLRLRAASIEAGS